MQDSRRQHVVPYTEWIRAEACGNIELTFYDLLDQLHSGHDAPSVEEALEAEHWTHAAFYPPVILFDNIVQAGASLASKVNPPTNAFRHSYASYWLAHSSKEGFGELSKRMGNSEAVCKRHYLETLTREEGAAWFKIRAL